MLEVRLVGTFDIKCDGASVTISSRAAQSLFAYLILTAGTLHRREKLAGMFWPDATEEKARAYLRHELWLIRKALSTDPSTTASMRLRQSARRLRASSKTDYLVADDINISFNASAEHWVDSAALKSLNESASPAQLMKGLSLFQGELLPGFYEDWITQEREHLQAVYDQKIARLLELLEGEKRWDDILEWAERWISFSQGSEAAYRYLMLAYDGLGDRAKVASTYQRCVKALRELDLEPSEQTRALAFKRNSKLNIPIPLTSFIGREKELKEIAGLFSKSRLVTLTGSGGVGKTRLAIQVVVDVLDRFPDGVWFLDLAPLSDSVLVPNTLAHLLGLRESSDTKISVTDLLINYFSSRTALVIFDNCEHLIESCAQLADLFLTSCENLSILATSRESLRLSGEIPCRVPSLEVPKSDNEFVINEISNIESVRLFAQRAVFASSSFAINSQNALAISRICQRLDGIPLAIELAAARVNILQVEEILEQLSKSFALLAGDSRMSLPRHQTLRASMEWSWGLLSEPEQRFMRRLSIFAGGWILGAAQAVCAGDVLNLTSTLAKKSLVVVDQQSGRETRYRFHEIVRQYVREKLIESGEEANIRTRHSNYFVQLSEQTEIALRGPEQASWYSHVHNERDNIRAALEWADETDVEAGLYISGRLYRFWQSFNVPEGIHWLQRFLQKAISRNNSQAKASALHAYAWLLTWSQQFVDAHTAAQECLEIHHASGDRSGEIDGLTLLGEVMVFRGDSEAGLDLIQQASILSQSIGDLWREANAYSYLGWDTRDIQRSLEYWEKALLLYRKVSDQFSAANMLGVLGQYRVLNCDFELGEKYLDDAIVLWQSNPRAIVWDNPKIAKSLIALERGDHEQAHALLQEVLFSAKEAGNRTNYLWTLVRLGFVAVREGNLDEARANFTEAVPEFVKDTIEIGVVFALEGMAELYVALGKPKHAAQLIGWADMMRNKISDPRPLLEQRDVDKIIAVCITKMGEAAFLDAYDDGKKMTLDEAVAYALKKWQ